MAHTEKKPICAALVSRCVTYLPRLGGRDVGIRLKLTKDKVEYTVITLFDLVPPAVEAGESTSTICGVGRTGRISLGRFLLQPPTFQVSIAGVGEGGSSLNAAGG